MEMGSVLAVLSSRGYIAAIGGSLVGAFVATAAGLGLAISLGDSDSGLANLGLLLLLQGTLTLLAVAAVPTACFWAIRRGSYDAAALTAVFLLILLAPTITLLAESFLIGLVAPFLLVAFPIIARAAALWISDHLKESSPP